MGSSLCTSAGQAAGRAPAAHLGELGRRSGWRSNFVRPLATCLQIFVCLWSDQRQGVAPRAPGYQPRRVSESL